MSKDRSKALQGHYNAGQKDSTKASYRPPTGLMDRNFPVSKSAAKRQSENDKAYNAGYKNGRKQRGW